MLLVPFLPAAPHARAAESPDALAIGYYLSGAGLAVEQVPWRHFTDVCHAYLTTDGRGEPLTDNQMPSRPLTEAAHRHGVRVLVSLGGGKTAEGLARAASSRASLIACVRGVTRLVAENGYDGVDIHWEFPRDRATRAGFVALVKFLRVALDAQRERSGRDEPYLLTAVVSPSAFFGKWIDTGATIGRLDWLGVMAYDMAGPWSKTAGHHAPLLASPEDPERRWRSVAAAMDYWHTDRGVPKGKLVLGVPLYARVYPVAERFAELDPAARAAHGTLAFSQVRRLAGAGWLADVDPDSRAAWLSPPDDRPLLIAYDDRNTVELKAEWARRRGYRGLYFWAMHHDRMEDGDHWLLRAAGKAWPLGGPE